MKTQYLRVSHLKRSVIYRPLAVVLALLMMPTFSWLESTAGIPLGANARAFQSSAQVVIGRCSPSQPNAIIQVDCPGGILYALDLYQLESDAVNAYLGLHGLPAGDAASIYTYGRSDLRSAVRADMVSILAGIANKPAAQRTAHEQNLYNWLQGLLQQNEIAEYTLATSQYHLWQNDPCEFTLDSNIASEYGLSYDGFAFCGGSLSSLYGGPPVPAESYFIDYGLENSYGAPGKNEPDFGALVSQTGLGMGEVAGISTAAGGVVAGIVGGVIGASVSAAAAAFAAGGDTAAGFTSTISAAAFNATFVVSGATVDSFGTVFLAAGPAAIILIAVAIGVAAGMQVFNEQQTIDDLNNLTATLTQVTNTPPDLYSFFSDPSGLGMYKIQGTMVAQTLPALPSSAALPVHRPNTDLNFSTSGPGGSASSTLTYKDWDGNSWSAQTYGGWFVQTCNSGAKCTQADSYIASIEYVDWSGNNWTASRLGNNFVSTKGSPAPTDAPCAANQTTGVTPVPTSGNFNACSSYVSASIPLQDPSGNHLSVSLAVPPPPPAFTSPTTLSFTPGQASTQTIVVSGSPAPAISATSNPLTADFSLTCATGSGSCQLAFNGDANAPAQNYQLTLQASPGSGSPVTQTFTVVVNLNLTITSPNSFNGTAGSPVNFLVTTTGSPIPSLSVTPGFLPPGLTFTDNHNGTANITGTSDSALEYLCPVVFPGPQICGIVATNSNGSITQPVTINFQATPTASLVGNAAASFIAGAPNSVGLTSTGAITPVSYLYTPPANAPWLVFHDNGDGTAVLSGTPPAGTTGTYSFYVTPDAIGSNVPQQNPYTVTVVDQPVFLSPAETAFLTGVDATFNIQTNGVAAITSYAFPTGLTFNSGNPATLTGTPAPGTGGAYSFTLTGNGGSAGSASQQFTLNIYEAAQITSSNTATFFTGIPGYFAVTASGYPSLSTKPVPANSMPPNSPTEGQGMYFTVAGLPADLQYSNLNPQGYAGGTLTIQGTPSPADAGLHQLTITATNGVGVAAQQTLSLDIVKITGSVPASGKTCNGNYNGTFNGSITVSRGQNCSFVDGGGVTGNVAMQGGSFAIANGTIGANVQIQGASAFSFGPGTKIGGNLAIDLVASGANVNQICGAKVLGNVEVIGNATKLNLGSGSPDSCPGNAIGGNLAVDLNLAPIAVYNNAVGKNLSCALDASIKGAGNTAEGKLGECSAF